MNATPAAPLVALVGARAPRHPARRAPSHPRAGPRARCGRPAEQAPQGARRSGSQRGAPRSSSPARARRSAATCSSSSSAPASRRSRSSCRSPPCTRTRRPGSSRRSRSPASCSPTWRCAGRSPDDAHGCSSTCPMRSGDARARARRRTIAPAGTRPRRTRDSRPARRRHQRRARTRPPRPRPRRRAAPSSSVARRSGEPAFARVAELLAAKESPYVEFLRTQARQARGEQQRLLEARGERAYLAMHAPLAPLLATLVLLVAYGFLHLLGQAI